MTEPLFWMRVLAILPPLSLLWVLVDVITRGPERRAVKRARREAWKRWRADVNRQRLGLVPLDPREPRARERR